MLLVCRPNQKEASAAVIIKSSARYGAANLAAHLTSPEENERIQITQIRDLCSETMHDALIEMQAVAAGTRCKSHLYHVMMNPDREMDEQAWDRTWQLYEQEYGLEDQPFIEVEHHKQGRTHRHRVYDRISDEGKAIEIQHNFARNEKIARIAEYELGHGLTAGRHNASVAAKLREEGREEIADWLDRAIEIERPQAEKSHGEHQQEKRSTTTLEQVKEDISNAWHRSDSGQSFE